MWAFKILINIPDVVTSSKLTFSIQLTGDKQFSSSKSVARLPWASRGGNLKLNSLDYCINLYLYCVGRPKVSGMLSKLTRVHK